jgi:hypothetical protein
VIDHILGGWQVSNIVSAQTGHYFTVTLSNPRQRLGATGIGAWRPDRIAGGLGSDPSADGWLDPTAFVLPRNADGSFRFGNAGRSILPADGVFNMDAGVMKVFPLTESVHLQVRAEAFNVTNTPTLADPNSNLDSPDFGKIRGTVSTPRQLQFAVRISF